MATKAATNHDVTTCIKDFLKRCGQKAKGDQSQAKAKGDQGQALANQTQEPA